MRVSTADEEGLAISFDASECGLLIGSAIHVEEGDTLSVTFRAPPDYAKEGRVVEGKVVRVAPNEDDPGGLWPRRLAVEFEEPIADLESVIAANLEKSS